ncbi:MAG: gliding motility lipoprotein GldH [Chlorobi bacterium]|nr:gliding motility lipoprotein GldH [Chlorobiota bacterium]
MQNKANLHYLFIIVVLIVLAACSNKVIEKKELLIDEQGWNRNNKFEDQIEIDDTLNSYNIYITITLNKTYSLSNLYLFVSTYMPYNNFIKDTVNCELAFPNGEWLGKKQFEKIINKLPYKMNVKFPYKGLYKFEIEQAMRIETLKGVKSCGMIIEKFN